MPYLTTNKLGDTVEVSDEFMLKLISSGKKRPTDFKDVNKELDSIEDKAKKQAEIKRLRLEGQDLKQQAEYLSQNPQMQDDQISGFGDALSTGIARFAFPNASRAAERGASKEDILASSIIETPNIAASILSPSMSVRNALGLGGVGIGTSAASRYSTDDEQSGLEMGLSGLAPMIPTVGSTVANRLGLAAKQIAPNVLHSVVVPKSGVMKGANPPDFEFALKEKTLIPKKGTLSDQIEGFEKNLKTKVSDIAGSRESLPSWQNEKVNMIDGVFLNAKQNKDLQFLDLSERKAVLNAIDDLRLTYANEWGKKWKTVGDAMEERSKLNSSSGVFKTDSEALAVKKKAKAIIAKEIGNYVKNVAPEVMEETAKMAPYMGLLRPVENAADLTRSKTIIPLGMTQSMMAGGMAGGVSGAALGLAAHQLAKTPAGAQRLYNVGEILTGKFPKTARASRVITGTQGRNIED